MSLPDYVRFYNKENELIAAVFVNVGWWITDELFTDVVVEPFSKIYLKDAEYATCYGIKISKEMFPKTPL